MFGGGSKPKPAPYTPAPPYQNAPPFINSDPANSNFEKYVPQVMNPGQIMAGALGQKYVQHGKGADNSSEAMLGRYAPWLSLQQAPTDAYNMNQAEQQYLNRQALPQMAQDQSNLFANGQGGSSYAGAYLGQEQAMNNLNAWNAGLNQQQADFSNVLNARNALYSQPIALGQQQNAANVARGLGVAGLDLQQTLGENQYNLANNQGLNNYNLGVNQIHNGYNSSIFGTQGSMYGSQLGAGASMFGSGLNFIGGLAHDVIGGFT